MKKKHQIHRDAGTGAFVSREFAKENPGSTVAETVETAALDLTGECQVGHEIHLAVIRSGETMIMVRGNVGDLQRDKRYRVIIREVQ